MLVRIGMVSFGQSARLATANEVQIGTRSEAIDEILLVESRDWEDFRGSNTLYEDLTASDATTDGEVSESIIVLSAYLVVMPPMLNVSTLTSRYLILEETMFRVDR